MCLKYYFVSLRNTVLRTQIHNKMFFLDAARIRRWKLVGWYRERQWFWMGSLVSDVKKKKRHCKTCQTHRTLYTKLNKHPNPFTDLTSCGAESPNASSLTGRPPGTQDAQERNTYGTFPLVNNTSFRQRNNTGLIFHFGRLTSSLKHPRKKRPRVDLNEDTGWWVNPLRCCRMKR